MKFLLLIYFIFVFGISFSKSRNIFSISKVYLVILFTFFGEVFWENQNPYILFLVFFLISISFLIFIIESNITFIQSSIVISPIAVRKMERRIWVLSLIPILAQFYLINSIGDFSSFISSINSRVVSWQSFGVAILLIKVINVLNYLYFIIIIKFHPINKRNIYLYLVHLIIFIGISLLSGSRSTLLWNFVFMLMFYNFSIKKVSLRWATIGSICILITASFIGFIRSSGIKYENNTFSIQKNVDQKLEFSNFSYGIVPLEKLFEKNVISDPEYGWTYITAITNLVPRSIWPDKPPSGGVIITEKYFDNRYDGYSYFTTGVISEAIINFGFLFGIVFGLFQMSVLLILLAQFAKKRLFFQRKNYNMFEASIYPFLLVGVCSYLYTEFTTNTISLFVYKIFEFYIIYLFVVGPRNNYFIVQK
ncbi:O-antigen polymerase [Algoriphagus mannitolivorans]|uniref:O-antigen polymerase n=1 Tax=Algoriphagus mannitolivorans TaxID=226504 RepID=UPI00040A22C9|nr:O-antigen polymerase [Algoriphagus mannitolivorans]